MASEICKMKEAILRQAECEIAERGIERMDVDRVGDMIDMVHHLAEAEVAWWQAEYYRVVIEAMELGSITSSDIEATGFNEALDPVRDMMRNASPGERERMRNEVKTMIGAM